MYALGRSPTLNDWKSVYGDVRWGSFGNRGAILTVEPRGWTEKDTTTRAESLRKRSGDCVEHFRHCSDNALLIIHLRHQGPLHAQVVRGVDFLTGKYRGREFPLASDFD